MFVDILRDVHIHPNLGETRERDMNGNINLANLMTAQDLASALGVSLPKAKTYTDKLQAVIKVGRSKVYDRQEVMTLIRNENAAMLNFLGVRPAHESYDAHITDLVSNDETV